MTIRIPKDNRTKNLMGMKAHNKKVVSDFFEEHPNATIADGIRATGMSRATVTRHRDVWEAENNFKENSVTIDPDTLDITNIIKFYRNNPEGTSKQCSEATGIDVKIVTSHLRQLTAEVERKQGGLS